MLGCEKELKLRLKLLATSSFCGPFAEQPFQFFLEFADVFEVAIDGGKADVGDGVEALEVLHDQLADFAGGAFALGGIHEECFGGVDDLFQAGRTETGRFSQARSRPLRIFCRSKRSRRPSFFTTM